MWEGREVLGEKMKPAMFRYKMALAGYCDYDIGMIESWLQGRHINKRVIEEEMYAVSEYVKVSKDKSMIPVFIMLVDDMYKNCGVYWEEAVKWVVRIIVGWDEAHRVCNCPSGCGVNETRRI